MIIITIMNMDGLTYREFGTAIKKCKSQVIEVLFQINGKVDKRT
jgi:hypothetical protein